VSCNFWEKGVSCNFWKKGCAVTSESEFALPDTELVKMSEKYFKFVSIIDFSRLLAYTENSHLMKGRTGLQSLNPAISHTVKNVPCNNFKILSLHPAEIHSSSWLHTLVVPLCLRQYYYVFTNIIWKLNNTNMSWSKKMQYRVCHKLPTCDQSIIANIEKI